MAYTYLGEYVGNAYNLLGELKNGDYKFSVQLWYEQDITNNLTRLKIQPRVTKIKTATASTWYWRVMGEENWYSYAYGNLHTSDYIQPPEAIRTIYHNADGTKSFTFQARVDNEASLGANAGLNTGTMKRGELSVNLSLPTIPRTSDFTISGDTLGSNITVNITRASTAFTHSVIYRIGNSSLDTTSAGKVATSKTFLPDLATGAAMIPNAPQGQASVTVKTYNGNTLIGEKTKAFTIKVPSSVMPTLGTITVTGSNLIDNLYVTTHSTAKLSMTASGKYGSSISRYEISFNGKIYGTDTVNSTGTLPPGDTVVTFKATDSRGRTVSTTRTISVVDYGAPKISNFNVVRCNSSGITSNTGTYVKASFDATIIPIGANNANAKKYFIQYKEKSSSVTTWTTWVNKENLSAYSGSFTTGVRSGFEAAKSYEFRIQLFDTLNSSSILTTEISTSSCSFNVENNGVGIGKYWEQGGLDVRGRIYSEGLTTTEKISTSSDIEALAPGRLVAQKIDGASIFLQVEPTSNIPRLRFGGTGTGSDRMQIQASGDTLVGEFSKGGFVAGNLADTTETISSIRTRNKHAGMYISTADNFGLYDWTNSRSILQYNFANNAVTLHGKNVMYAISDPFGAIQ